MSILEHEQPATAAMAYSLRPMLPEDAQAVAEHRAGGVPDNVAADAVPERVT